MRLAPPIAGHTALFCGHALHWRRTVIPFLVQGLRQGERCLYLTALHPPSLILSQLAMEGLDLDGMVARGQLAVADAGRAYLDQGVFDPDRVIEQWQRQAERLLARGWPGLRTVADMSWACYRPPGWELLGEYEERLNSELFPRYPLQAICFYDRMMFPPATRQMLSRTHAMVVSDDLPARYLANS